MSNAQRKVVAWTIMSIDGYTSGPDGPAHDTWLHRHAGQEGTATYFEGIWRGCDTALLGRNNYEGFHAVWPGITADPATDARMRELGQWLGRVEKVVISTTIEDAPWENSRIARDLEAEVASLKAAPGRDIIALNGATLIQTLLAADLVDDLRLAVVPVVLGGGLRLFSEGLPSSEWKLVDSTSLEHGAVGLHWRRA